MSGILIRVFCHDYEILLGKKARWNEHPKCIEIVFVTRNYIYIYIYIYIYYIHIGFSFSHSVKRGRCNESDWSSNTDTAQGWISFKTKTFKTSGLKSRRAFPWKKKNELNGQPPPPQRICGQVRMCRFSPGLSVKNYLLSSKVSCAKCPFVAPRNNNAHRRSKKLNT